MKKKLILIITITLGVATISGIVGYYIYSEVTAPTPEEKAAAKEFVEANFKEPVTLEEKAKIKVLWADNMSEYRMQNTIHNMSHQKVQAKEKWGHSEIKQAKVERLLDVVNINKENYKHENIYIKILERWSKGDFSQAVEDHNAIWKLQDGTIGEAYRLLTPIEEERYIQKHFKE